MPVSWSATLGYGLQLDVLTALEEIRKNEGYGDFYNLIDDLPYHVDKEYPLLQLAWAGDNTSGGEEKDREEWIFIASTVVKLDDWAVDVDLEKIKAESMNQEACEQLFTFVHETGAAIGPLQWKLLLTCG